MDIITETLYIRIDETPMPLTQPELVKLVKTVDCRLLNDFYSIFGDALCGDLTAPDGRPLYRLITPAGRILAEYAASDDSSEAMADLRKQWYDLLATILDGSAAPTFTFTLPTHFRRWLDRYPSNDLYPILASQTSVTLNTADYAAEIREQADKIINGAGFTDCKRYVFSTPVSSQAWYQEIQKIFEEKFSEPANSDDISIDGCILGKADWWMFAWLGAEKPSGRHKPFEYLNYKEAQIWFKDGIWNLTYVTRSNSYPFSIFLQQVTGRTHSDLPNGSYRFFVNCCSSFRISKSPYRYSTYFCAEIEKGIPYSKICKLEFFYDFHNSSKYIPISEERADGTLYSIRIEQR